MLIRFIILFAVLLLIDIYFFQAVKTISSGWTDVRRMWTFRIYWGFSAFSLLFGLFSMLTYQNPWFNKYIYLYVFCFIFIVVISKLIGSLFLMVDDLQRLVRWVIGFFNQGVIPADGAKSGGISRAKFLSYTALTVAALPFTSMIYGMIKTAFDFTIRRNKIPIANLPAGFEGLKIVQISDIHSGSFASDEPFKRAVEMIMSEKPDVIFFTGDLVNDKSAEAERHIETWKKLSAPLGVYSILGNHDYGDYVEWDSREAKAANLQRLKEIHKEMGWDMLNNEHRILERNGDQIGLLGVENWGEALRFPRKGDIVKAKAGMPEVPVKILLSHDPSHWHAQVLKSHSDIDLTLSGHTHGFQFGIEIPGFKWSPSQYVYKQWAGLYSEGKQHIYVNRGLGFLGYLGRVGIKPEITIIELSKA
ncbi:MAG TPA: metallophosphoesterase [Flavobacteriales bacterium]|nr:metallophosphoesterase [Flavobacteriales bacterium]HPH81583.1 metallophosphoesterase [Flavobacteriales bacterium]